MTAASDPRVVGIHEIGSYYATTLASWRANLLGRVDAVCALGYPESFIRCSLVAPADPASTHPTTPRGRRP